MAHEQSSADNDGRDQASTGSRSLLDELNKMPRETLPECTNEQQIRAFLKLAIEHHEMEGWRSQNECIARRCVGNPTMRMLTISLGSWRREFDDALALFARAIELDPGTPEFHANHGNVLRMKSRLDEAEAAFMRALSLWPDFPEGLMNLATLRRNRGNLEDAEKLLRRAHSSSLVAPGARTVFNFSSFSLGSSSRAKPAACSSRVMNG